jgi:hypothetical protein
VAPLLQLAILLHAPLDVGDARAKAPYGFTDLVEFSGHGIIQMLEVGFRKLE